MNARRFRVIAVLCGALWLLWHAGPEAAILDILLMLYIELAWK